VCYFNVNQTLNPALLKLWDLEVCDERERERAVVDVGVLHSLHTNAGAHLICVNLIFCNIQHRFCGVLSSSSCKPCLLR